MAVKRQRPLTPGQKKVLDFIRKFAEKNGYSPSLSEIAKFLKKSISTAQHYVEELQNRGYLRKEENIARGITPISEVSDRIFLLGYIAAGEPIEPLENPEPIEVPFSMMRSPGNYYALKVKGNSMVDDGIFDGDIVVIKHQNTAESGDTIVAITERGVTLKVFRQIGKQIFLEPRNKDYPTIEPKELEIRGKFCGLIRGEVVSSKISPKGIIDAFVNTIIQGDCLGVMPQFPDKSIDMILCDLPYGTTQNKWDCDIPLDKLWKIYERIIKDNGVIALTSQGVFTAKLILSNKKLFKYKIVWEKSKPTNFLNAKKQPLRVHEDVCVFYKKQPIYHPQMYNGKPYNKGVRKNQLTGSYGEFNPVEVKSDGERYPVDVIYYKTAESEGTIYHPTQKPVGLARYLVRTFTNPGDIVLDNTCGSGSFLVAAVLEGRQFIGIEKNENTELHKKNKMDLIGVCNMRIKKAQEEIEQRLL